MKYFGAAIASLLAVGLIALSLPSAGDAHFKGKKRWYMGGETRGPSGGGPGGDPVNLFFYPYGTDSNHQTNVTMGHLGAHWTPQWTDLKDSRPICRGQQSLRFDVDGGGFVRPLDDAQGSGWDGRFRLFLPECRDRYHGRLWADIHHIRASNEPHGPSQSWVTAAFHHEDLQGRRILAGEGGHIVDLDWDRVELAVIEKMRRNRGGHRDVQGVQGGHGFQYRWKVLPGSKGHKGDRNFYSDGRISRISMLHR